MPNDCVASCAQALHIERPLTGVGPCLCSCSGLKASGVAPGVSLPEEVEAAPWWWPWWLARCTEMVVDPSVCTRWWCFTLLRLPLEAAEWRCARCGTNRPVKRSHASCVRPSTRLLRTYRFRLLTPSAMAPASVRLPVRVKSVFSAPVPLYSKLIASALLAQMLLNACSKVVKGDVSTLQPEAAVFSHAPALASEQPQGHKWQ